MGNEDDVPLSSLAYLAKSVDGSVNVDELFNSYRQFCGLTAKIGFLRNAHA